MNIEPNKIYKVFHTILYKKKNEGIFISDLQFENDKCYLVFNWTASHDGEHPTFRHEISQSLLVPVKSSTYDFLIENPVEIPEDHTFTTLIQGAKSRKKIKEIIGRRLIGATTEYNVNFPDVLKGEVQWISFSSKKLLMLMFLDDKESKRIHEYSSKGYYLFPGLFTTEQAVGAMMKMSNSKNNIVSNCTSTDMHSFLIGSDCTFIVQNHTQILQTNELGEIRYTVPLAYFVTFGDEITESNAYKSLEELIIYSIKSWGIKS